MPSYRKTGIVLGEKRLEEHRVLGPGEGRFMFIPPMCPFAARLMAAVFRAIGYQAEMLVENDETLALGYKNTAGGECVPCPCTTGALIHAMQKRNLKPEQVIFFMPTSCGPCRFGQYAQLNEIIFKKLGWEKIEQFSPSAENAYAGMDLTTRKNIYHSVIIADIIRKLGMKLRPYERNPGSVDLFLEEWMRKFEKVFEHTNPDAAKALEKLVDAAGELSIKNEKRPLVGIVGEIYVRSDPFINMNLYRRIEELGGEAWLAPSSEWILYTSECTRLVAKEKGDTALKRVYKWMEGHWFVSVEKKYYDIAEPILYDRREPHIPEIIAIGEQYLPWQYEGEAILTLGRAKLFKERDGAQ
ncbi:MAG: hypothetical protein JXA52_05190, partial [Planctomycetes bacterium]|nr:hypothetical protein [Planctomycetota bacterium]